MIPYNQAQPPCKVPMTPTLHEAYDLYHYGGIFWCCADLYTLNTKEITVCFETGRVEVDVTVYSGVKRST